MSHAQPRININGGPLMILGQQGQWFNAETQGDCVVQVLHFQDPQSHLGSFHRLPGLPLVVFFRKF